MQYREELTRVMTLLGKDERTIFLGQSVCYSGQAMFSTLSNVPMGKRVEMPVAEDMQMGISIGLSLQGYIPISLFTRMDFLLCAMNQLVNHLDKIARMSNNEFHPKVIVRTLVGSKSPLDGGLQHTGNYTAMLRACLEHVLVVTLDNAELIEPVYKRVMANSLSAVVIEYGELY